MASDDKLPLLQARPGDIAESVLVVGDPARAERASERLSDVVRVAANREYLTYTGRLGQRRLSICSHGIGAAGAGVCFEELSRAGVRVILRAGTCGAVRDDLDDGHLVIGAAAVCDEGLTPRLVPTGFPAAADYRLVAALRQSCTRYAASSVVGVVLTTDLFYPSEALGFDWQRWKASRVLAVEMELAPLLVIATLHGVAAAGIFTVDGNPTLAAADMSEYDPYRQVVDDGIEGMLDIALDALAGFPIDE